MKCKNKLTLEEVKLLKELYEKYSDDMYKVALKILKEPSIAEDALQQTFEKLMKYLERVPLDNENRTRAFMKSAVRNMAYDIIKKRKNENCAGELLEEIIFVNEDANFEEGNPLNYVTEKEKLEDLTEIISKLSKIYSDVIMYRYEYEMKYKDIAKLMNISEASVKKRMERARKVIERLRKGGIDRDKR